jgi:hypothetical protein
MKKLLILFILLWQSSYCQTLKVLNGVLFYKSKTSLIKIKELENNNHFQGYEMIYSTHIFIAYDSTVGSGEACTAISIFDLNTMKEYFLDELGDTGDSSFDYCPANNIVIFNWGSGIHCFDLPKCDNTLKRNMGITPKVLINSGGGSFDVMWINKHMVSYKECPTKDSTVLRIAEIK